MPKTTMVSAKELADLYLCAYEHGLSYYEPILDKRTEGFDILLETLTKLRAATVAVAVCAGAVRSHGEDRGREESACGGPWRLGEGPRSGHGVWVAHGL